MREEREDIDVNEPVIEPFVLSGDSFFLKSEPLRNRNAFVVPQRTADFDPVKLEVGESELDKSTA